MGCLVEVGRGRLAPDAAAAILARGDRTRAPATAPARGLCLTRVRYPA
jgi:tRNA pseudouridine38-40 synthase